MFVFIDCACIMCVHFCIYWLCVYNVCAYLYLLIVRGLNVSVLYRKYIVYSSILIIFELCLLTCLYYHVVQWANRLYLLNKTTSSTIDRYS